MYFLPEHATVTSAIEHNLDRTSDFGLRIVGWERIKLLSCLLVLQLQDDDLAESSRRLCACFGRNAAKLGVEMDTVVFGAGWEGVPEFLGQYGISQIFQVAGSTADYYSPEARVGIITELVREQGYELIILPDSLASREAAPNLALSLDAGLVSDCVEANFRHGITEVTTNVYNGQYQIIYELTGKRSVLVMADINPGAVEPAGQGAAQVVGLAGSGVPAGSVGAEEQEFSLQLLDTFFLPAQELDIGEADFIVGIGRGVQSADYQLVQNLAAAIGAPIGGSRPAVDAGLISFNQQIGQTGRLVSPEMYFALGISGAAQHISGIQTGKIIAVNTDPQAPILRLADLGVIGDFREIVPLLLRKMRQIREEGPLEQVV